MSSQEKNAGRRVNRSELLAVLEYMEEHGVECSICKEPAMEITIDDDGDTRAFCPAHLVELCNKVIEFREKHPE